MKLTRRKMFIFAFVAFVLVILISVSLTNNPSTTTAGDIPNEPTDVQGPQLVVPETPFGMIGVFMAIIAAIGAYSVVTKKKNNQ